MKIHEYQAKQLFERYGLGADETTRFTSWSVAKSITSTLVGFALADGAIASLSDPLERYLPEVKGTGYEGVTVAQTLQMSSGVGFSEDYEVSRLYRDARVLTIYEGTSEMQRLVISRHLLR